MDLMPIETIPDWEKRIARQDACWNCAIIDRPVVLGWLAKPQSDDLPVYPPEKKWASHRERWLDIEYTVECAKVGVARTDFLGDALPSVTPNLGPSLFSAFYGAEMEFAPGTTWIIPNLHDWNKASELTWSTDNFYWKTLDKLTDCLLEAGRNRFYTGITDIHPGGDAVAAFRDNQIFAMDLIDYPQEALALIERITDDYLTMFDLFYHKLRKARQAITTWTPIVSTKKWYIPSNDFSCMVSKKMFDHFFLPSLKREMDHMDVNIYHLDGPGALQHLDSLLAIPNLQIIQWVYGTGKGRSVDWMHIYKKCQQAGKGLWLDIQADTLDAFIANLRPEGLFITLGGYKTREEFDFLLKKIERWK